MEDPRRTIGEVFGKDACNNNDVSDVNAAGTSESNQEIGLTMPTFDDDFNDLSSHMSTMMEQHESPVHFPFYVSGLDFGGGSSLPPAQGFGSNDGAGGSFDTDPRSNATAPHPRQRRFRNGRTIIDSETMEEESEDMDMDGGDNSGDSDDTTYEYDTETDSETFTDDVEDDDSNDNDDDDSDDSGDDDAGGPDYMDDDGVYSGDDYGDDDEPPRVVHIEFGGRMIEAMPIYLLPPSPDRPFLFEEEDDTMEASNSGVQECEHGEASAQQLETIVP